MKCHSSWARVLYALSLAICLSAAAKSAPLCISEFLVDNQNGLKDEDGERSGWIEIHNLSGTPVSLTNWCLTDTRTNLTKWRFPAMSLLPEKYLVVFTSGKDRVRDLAHVHTNFRLQRRGGYLALVQGGTNIVSEFDEYPEQSPDVSFGRVPGELATTGRFLTPTPGKPNSTRGPGFAPEVLFSPAGGKVDPSASVQLSCGSSKAVIHYTTDGLLPTCRSPVYDRSLVLTNSMQLRARAYEDGLLPGPPRTASYFVLDSTLPTFTSNLPVLVLDNLGQSGSSLGSDSLAHLSVFEPVHGRTSLTNCPSLMARVAYHVRGSSSMNLPQSNFALHFLDEFNEELHQSILGLPSDSDWVLYAPNRFEPVMIHNPFVHQLSRDMGRYSPRTRFVELYHVTKTRPFSPRQYLGIYVLEERIKVGKHRVDIDRMGPADLKLPEVTGGYLLKIDRLGPNESGLWVGEAGIVYVEPKERVLSLPERAPQREFLAAYFTEFERALHGPNWKDPEHGYRAFIDVESWIDYHVLEVLTGNVDALVYSSYFYKPRNGKLVFGPHWDFDRALGSTDGRDDDPRQWNTGRFFSGPWWNRLFRDPDFWQLWVDRWQDLRQKQFSLSYINGLIDHLADQLREAQPREVERWDLQPRGGSYQAEVDWMKEWLSNRIDFIDGQLVTRPALKSVADEVTFSVPPGATVYFTLDGSDPRLPQGAISSRARIYSEPIRLEAETCLVARAWDANKRQTGGPRASTPWSGPVRTMCKSVVAP